MGWRGAVTVLGGLTNLCFVFPSTHGTTLCNGEGKRCPDQMDDPSKSYCCPSSVHHVPFCCPKEELEAVHLALWKESWRNWAKDYYLLVLFTVAFLLCCCCVGSCAIYKLLKRKSYGYQRTAFKYERRFIPRVAAQYQSKASTLSENYCRVQNPRYASILERCSRPYREIQLPPPTSCTVANGFTQPDPPPYPGIDAAYDREQTGESVDEVLTTNLANHRKKGSLFELY